MTLDEAICRAEKVADNKEREKQKWERWLEAYKGDDYRALNEKVSCEVCAKKHRQLAEWLKQLKEIKRILDAPSYKENGVTYSYCYDSKTKLKHIEEVFKND